MQPLPRTFDPWHRVQLAALPTVGLHLDAARLLAELGCLHFPDLRLPGFAWARDPGPHRRLRHIRYGSYYYQKVEIRLHPRLRRPWVAQLFVAMVLYHELCHHALACRHPNSRGHDRRFRRLEQAFPGFALARAWERCFVTQMLGPDPQ